MAYVGTLALGTVVVSGGARGVDLHAEGAARAQGLTVVSYRPTRLEGFWHIVRYTFVGHASETVWKLPSFHDFADAALYRNGLIVDDCDRLVAFWDGKSRGTRNSVRRAEIAEKVVEVRRPSPVLHEVLAEDPELL